MIGCLCPLPQSFTAQAVLDECGFEAMTCLEPGTLPISLRRSWFSIHL